MSINSALQAGVRPREVWAWAMYDFANSGYTTVVITAVFNAYFVGVVCARTELGHVCVDLGVVGQLRDRHLHRSDHRRLCRRSRGQEEAARDHDVGLRARHGALVLGRARRSGARVRADRVVERLLRHRRKHRGGVLAGARAGRGDGQGVGLGLVVGLHRRPDHARRLLGVRDRRPEVRARRKLSSFRSRC